MIFIGYEPGTKGYRFWSNNKRRVVISTTAVFNEYIYPNCSKEKNKPDNLPLYHTESRSTSDQDSSGSDTDSEDEHEDDGLMLRAINPGNPQPQQAIPNQPIPPPNPALRRNRPNSDEEPVAGPSNRPSPAQRT
ncbi:hypothetical protein PAXINDRAFT_90445 [Paxillus involutus ATCC 200175]|uniref:Retroviral polymerase SH3-like domain-containing protein n=1 Tax=Paxillus involutus ATCC 200175 TaxID=664439 RepID=A0A0C9TJ88_PAXIN|nr:hypothetical protein PAXINDRAFT_90445 [Paxillus involutus ATCC 200175]